MRMCWLELPTKTLTMKIEIDEGQRQMMILALAHLSIERPGWDTALNELALKMDNVEDGRAVMYDQFRKLEFEANPPPKPGTENEPIDTDWGMLRRCRVGFRRFP